MLPHRNFRKLKIWTICTILIGLTIHVFSNCTKPQDYVLNKILHLPTTEGRDEDMLSLLWAKFRWSVSLVTLASVGWSTAPCSMEETVDTGLPCDGSGPTFKKSTPNLCNQYKAIFGILTNLVLYLVHFMARGTKQIKVIIYPSTMVQFLFFYNPQARNHIYLIIKLIYQRHPIIHG